MSRRATDWAWQQDTISSTQKIVLLDLSDRANADNVCWPKQKTIAARTRLTERTVCSALAELESLNLIRRRGRVVGRLRTSDLITLVISSSEPPPAATPPTAPDAPGPKLQPEKASGEQQNVFLEPTGTNFSAISNDEPPRQNQTTPFFVEPFPDPQRPDQEATTSIIRMVEAVAQELGPAIDWSAPGINNLALVSAWLKLLDEHDVKSCLIKVARRVGGSAQIRSWKYFEAEIQSLCRAKGVF